MADNPDIVRLREALDSFQWPNAKALCQDLIARLDTAAAPYDRDDAKTILGLLRRKRQFDLMVPVADAFIRGGLRDPQIVRQYAQAMIDQGNLTASQFLLESLINGADTPDREKAEAIGLLGRVHKQLYVNANQPGNPRQQGELREAISQYWSVYHSNPKDYLWHGINCVALLSRADRDKVAPGNFPPASQISQAIEDCLKAIGNPNCWDLATGVENAVARNDFYEALAKAVLFLQATDSNGAPQADAFEVASLLRQLEEVWKLTEGDPMRQAILSVLKSGLLKRSGGSLQLPLENLKAETKQSADAEKQYEKVFGTDRYQPLGWYRKGLQCANAVARVESVTGKHIGSGFLVKAGDFFPNSNKPEQLLFLTNAHVISPLDKPFPGALPPEAAVVVFEASNNKTCKVTELIWSSSPDKLDATFVALEGLEDLKDCCQVIPAAAPFNSARPQRLYIIGYPLGGGLSFSLQDSVWLDAAGDFLHYRTPTEPGSSGSPVFDQDYWTLVAIHHSGNDTANEGVSIAAIKAAASASPAT